MSTDSLQDPWAELRRMEQRLSRLETASPLEHASISRDGITILTPGGEGGGNVELYKLGHGGADKSGFLFKDGNDWKKLEVYIDERVNAGTAFPNARLTDIEGRMASAEAGINFTANRTTDLEGRTGGLEGRMATAEGGITYTGNRVGDLEGRMSNAESSLNTKASTSAMQTAVQKVADDARADAQKIASIYNAHIDSHHSGGPKINL